MICATCSVDRPATEYYTGRRTCKECVRRNVRSRAKTNPAVQEYDRERAKTLARRQKSQAIAKRWRENNPLAYRAQTAVSNAVRDGRIFREPCVICGREDVHAHHKDYAKPLDVTWLCPKCHHRLHAAFPELEGRNKSF